MSTGSTDIATVMNTGTANISGDDQGSSTSGTISSSLKVGSATDGSRSSHIQAHLDDSDVTTLGVEDSGVEYFSSSPSDAQSVLRRRASSEQIGKVLCLLDALGSESEASESDKESQVSSAAGQSEVINDSESLPVQPLTRQPYTATDISDAGVAVVPMAKCEAEVDVLEDSAAAQPVQVSQRAATAASVQTAGTGAIVTTASATGSHAGGTVSIMIVTQAGLLTST
jgi:hypothetical protein